MAYNPSSLELCDGPAMKKNAILAPDGRSPVLSGLVWCCDFWDAHPCQLACVYLERFHIVPITEKRGTVSCPFILQPPHERVYRTLESDPAPSMSRSFTFSPS